MKYTSAEANKLYKKLKEEESFLNKMEIQNSTFNAAVGEDPESVRPEYDFFETKRALEKVQAQIRTVKHAINVFNTTTTIGGGMTIDQVLVYLPQLTYRQQALRRMMMVPPKARTRVLGSGANAVIDYAYTNYDPKDVEEEFKSVTAKIDVLQLALDKVNTTATMEINLPE